MRKLIVLIATCAALGIFVSEASAMKMTPQQVQSTCGSGLQSSTLKDGTTASGCDKKCSKESKHICTYNCCTGPSCKEQGCSGNYVGRTIFGGKVKLPMAAYLRLVGSSRAHQR
jgi:hypothetical protein